MATQTIRIFLVYAEEDYKFRDLLVEQTRSSRLPVEFLEMPTKQPWVERWKGVCRTRAFQCQGAIVLISKKTKQGSGVKWELECAGSASLPTLGVIADKSGRETIPDEIRDEPVIQWNWPEIAAFLQSLGTGGSASRTAV